VVLVVVVGVGVLVGGVVLGGGGVIGHGAVGRLEARFDGGARHRKLRGGGSNRHKKRNERDEKNPQHDFP
jgi:hypothetical protein